MSQRRSRAEQSEEKPFSQAIGPVAEGELKLDEGDEDVALGKQSKKELTPLSIDERYFREREEARIKHWRDSPFAAGLVNVSWRDEGSKGTCGGLMQENVDPDSGGCLCCSSLVCGGIGAGRVGNMAVLSQSNEWVEEVEEDEETGEQKVRRFTRPTLHFVVGPYWPMLVCVTYPLILGVSMWTLLSAIPGKHVFLQLLWLVCTVGLIYALAMTAFKDPGILYKHNEPPPQSENDWRWNDSAQSYRPRGAFYDPDCAVVVEGFDHT
jgi:hypothetical protein